MSSETGGSGLPGGFPSMPGFGRDGAEDGELRERLEELTERRRAGVLTAAEFEAERERLLSGA